MIDPYQETEMEAWNESAVEHEQEQEMAREDLEEDENNI